MVLDRHKVMATSLRQPGRSQLQNPFIGIWAGIDFDACMGAGMKFEKNIRTAKETKRGNSAPDFMNVNAQFAKFFGFTPKNKKKKGTVLE